MIGPEARVAVDDLGPMARSLAHRGPDDFGLWCEGFDGGRGRRAVALGHTRLSVLDLSARGRQPMTSGDGRAVIVLNGEIYNFRELRDELGARGRRFRSRTDTEVLLEGYREWGGEVVERLHGMFAFAIWDAERRTLLLARDRIGIKPLYYALAGELLLFASELRALRSHPAFDPEIDRGALGRFLSYGYVTGPETIYRQARRLPPGSCLEWTGDELTLRPYWDLLQPPDEPPRRPEEVVDRLERRLGDAVAERLVADVPLGAFLSGGIDSSTVVAVMQERIREPVRTFSIGFWEPGFDEAPYARRVARHLGTDHTELYVDRDQAADALRDLPDLYDEPFGDSSAIPTLLVSRLARQQVTVALTGDGGDELFGGYSRYRRAAGLERLFRLPPAVRRGVAGAARLLPHPGLRDNLGLLRHGALGEACERQTARFPPPLIAACCGAEGAAPRAEFRRAFDGASSSEGARRAMYADVRTYLPDDILTKVDRASMSVGLEVRVPLLDHRVTRFALSLPLAMLWQNGVAKSPLRALAFRHIPRALLERPKRGFALPLESLFAAELTAWRERLLAPSRLAEEGHLDPAAVARMLALCDARGPRGARGLWNLICFQRWFARVHRGERDA